VLFTLEEIVKDFAICLKIADGKHPQAINVRSKDAFKPGIGPHSESDTIELVVTELKLYKPNVYYDRVSTTVPYPEASRQRCDLCFGSTPLLDWAIEVKMLRMLGDNGKLNDNILMHILSPYSTHRSALTDCIKLAGTKLAAKKAILIYGYDHDDWPLVPAIDAFEVLARSRVKLGPRAVADFQDLIHPIHKQGSVFAWEINAL
jgi:hypothetical protein